MSSCDNLVKNLKQVQLNYEDKEKIMKLIEKYELERRKELDKHREQHEDKYVCPF